MRLVAILRRRPLLADVGLAVLLAASALVESTQPGRAYTRPVLMVPLALLVTLPLALRRRHPLTVLTLMTAAAAGMSLLGTMPASAVLFLALLVAEYTVVTRSARREQLAAVPVLVLGALLTLTHDSARRSAAEAIPTLVVLAAVWGLGAVVRGGRAREQRLRSLSVELAASRVQAERAAALAERLRIARDMHDVLAHSVSVMVLHAGAARMAVGDQVPAATGLLEQAEEVGRDALQELRVILGLLRRQDTGTDLLVPAHGDLDRVVEFVRTAGLPVSITGGEMVRELPEPVQLTVTRVVQEGLTNALKHAGAPPTTVAIVQDDEEVVVEVRNGPGSPVSPRLPSGGHGLLGLEERVLAHGGSLTWGPDSAGWTVRAAVPIEAPQPVASA
jgi:signal transduction histidine kinase